MNRIFLSITLFVLTILSVNAQTGTLRGMMYEDATGEPILFGEVFVASTSDGTTSDLDGAYALELSPGTYTVTFAYLGYADLNISDVIITDGEVTTLDARLKEDTEVLEEVVITATQAKNTEAALATIKRKSSNVIDGISSASFKRMGDSNAAAAAKRVPGVSIEGGKYVFVRGLGDRYTKSILNGMDIPGLDPDRNTLQMDIFPTNVLDNIIVLKTFTADLPADFTGGVVNIATKAFPEDRKMSVSLGAGYNPNMHFRNDFLTYTGGSTDLLGFDDGTRAIPTKKSSRFPRYVDAIGSDALAQSYNGVLRKFDNQLAASQANSFMDWSVGFTTGDQININDNTIGYNLALSYKQSTDFYEEYINANYGKPNDKNIFKLDRQEYQNGQLGEQNVLLGGLAGLAFKTKTSKFKLNLLHLQNAEKSAGNFNFFGSDKGSNFEAKQYNLEFSERSMSNAMLNGEHSFGQGAWKLDWRVSPTLSRQTDPDIRFTRIRELDNGNYAIGTESGIPERIWRYLVEYSIVGKADVVRSLKLWDNDAKIKFGAGNSYKERDYEIQNFQIFPGSNTQVTADPNDLMKAENLFSTENKKGVYYTAAFVPNNPNKYNSDINNTFGYVSAELEPVKGIKAILGVRGENYNQQYKGENQRGEALSEQISNFGIFPSANLIFSLNDKFNIRTSYTQTVARPSFKEASYATIIDPLSGRTFIGGFYTDVDVLSGEEIWDGKLKETNISNFDLRLEYFQERGNGVSISGFYKHFVDPIEIVQYAQAPSNLQPRNVGNGKVVGAELEVKQSLGLLTDALKDLSVNANVTYTQSSIDFTQKELRSREQNARAGEKVEKSRVMAGQAPYLINAGLAYNSFDTGFEAGVYYNVQGPTLQYVGIADRPDVYSRPFHGLNFTASKRFGKINLGLKVDNLLDQKRENYYRSYKSDDEIFSSKYSGRSFSVSLGYRFI